MSKKFKDKLHIRILDIIIAVLEWPLDKIKTKRDEAIAGLCISILVGGGLMIAGSMMDPETSWKDVLSISGFCILLYFGGSNLLSLFSGKSEMGSSTTTYTCSCCKQELHIKDVPSDEGIGFNCPNCGEYIVS